MTADENNRRWAARPIQAGLIRAFVFVVPITGSVLFLHFVGRLIPPPSSSLLLFISWWLVMSGAATLVLVGIDRVARRLLPLAALYKLSLVFPDAAPSRFHTALRSNTVESLESRIARAKALNRHSTSVEAAERLLALAGELDGHDRLTRGHAERVRAYAQLIAQEMRLGPRDRDLLNWAALLHDIGKLNVPSEILAKAGRPTDEEWSILRRHPEFGMELVAPLRGWLGQWTEAVAQHHERWDGKGYPAGISGDRIALAARIVAVADVFDVMTSARSYKEASASDAARDELARCAGSQLDPRVVRAFLNVSLGRLRLVMGPLSWLAHAPLLGRLPLTPAIGTAAASLATVAAAVTTGFAGPPPTPSFASALPTGAAEESATRHVLERVTREDHRALIGVEAAAGGSSVTSLQVLGQPQAGRATVSSGRKLVYAPPPNYNGGVSVIYRACWSDRGCRTGVVEIIVQPVNDSPITRNDTGHTRRGAQVAVHVLSNDSDPDGDRLSIRSVLDPRKRGRARIAGNRILWRPGDGFLGKATLRYTATDGHGGVGRASLTIRVARAATAPSARPNGGNQPPSVAPPTQPDQPQGSPAPPSQVDTNQAPRAASDTASVPEGGTVIVDALANDSDPDRDSISIASVGTPERGRVRRVGNRIEFSAPSNFVGDISFPYSVTDTSGASDEAQIVVSVVLVNTPPSFTAGPGQVVLEDAGAQRIPRWATNIDPGGTNEAGQKVSFLVSSNLPDLFSTAPEVDPNGLLTYRPAPNAYGVATMTVRAIDDGGTANGGGDTSARAVFTITVKPVNDPPSFVPGEDQTVQEDAGAQAVAGWAQRIDPGPNERSQRVSFVVTNGRPGLFTDGGRPRVAENGTLSYTPGPDANGSTKVTVRTKDDGGTASGGDDTGPASTFTITVGPVNDPPSFAAGPALTVPEDAGPQGRGGWVTNISPGPADESGQQVTFHVSSNDASLFSAQPAIAPNGTLSYTPAANATGTASVTVRARDDGGGTDTSAPQTFAITITPVNDPPVANPDSVTVSEGDPAGATLDVLANDTDVDAGDTLAMPSYDGSTVTHGILTHVGGGSFNYVPDPGFSGTETFTYVAADSAGATASATATITVTAVPSSPLAGDDAYLTPQDTPLSVGAPGVLSNDGDQDGDSLSVQTSPVSGPTNGTVLLSSDGSFTYTPASGFTGTDSFTYRVEDGTGRSADGVVDLTVTAGAVLTSTLYFQPSGPSVDVWDMTLGLAPPASQLVDFDGDGKPGLTIKNSDGAETETNSARFQDWRYPTPGPLVLNGPVTLDLWSSTGLFVHTKSGEIYTYLYDCAPGGVSCTNVGSNVTFHDPWNLSPLDWTRRQITVASVSHTIPAGNELHVKVLFHPSDLWITMSTSYPSALVMTVG